ncbi:MULTISPECIES: hypothetical protein [unclassified Acinetobacter]|uniref:hypothetical protein n=1 Tax=unclassified Acinetobacter TaxID=196816 RepID=UPI0015D2E024|nr:MULTISPECIES: hypothetical protein [unclassified Acinetobacter]UUS57980.1 hypothetical protein MST16_01875 [Acinetobacter sp. YH16040_T]
MKPLFKTTLITAALFASTPLFANTAVEANAKVETQQPSVLQNLKQDINQSAHTAGDKIEKGVDKTKTFTQEKWQDTKEFSADKKQDAKNKWADLKQSKDEKSDAAKAKIDAKAEQNKAKLDERKAQLDEKAAKDKAKLDERKSNVDNKVNQTKSYLGEKAQEGRQFASEKWQQTKANFQKGQEANVSGSSNVQLQTPVAQAEVHSSHEASLGAHK